ncbi:Na(+)/H(+) antiporter subunit B [Halomonas sp. E19]|uniref:Na(+)/H(+) antiporter subunit B n=1 Tax=Halomonas sp. E19 TaxID=3397247 RepID=UPI004034E454
MTTLAWGFDALLAAGMLWLGWQALFLSRRFAAVVHFMAFQLLMALAWVRLSAPDIALAEAAVGAGVTGALLLTALGRLPAGTSLGAHPHRWQRPCAGWRLAPPASALAGWPGWPTLCLAPAWRWRSPAHSMRQASATLSLRCC